MAGFFMPIRWAKPQKSRHWAGFFILLL